MRAGVAKIDINPQAPIGAFMTGYTAGPDMPAAGVHDPLYARTLVLDDGSIKMALVALDLIGLNPGRLPALARGEGIDHVLLAATHTHGGPLVLNLYEPYGEFRNWPEGNPYLTWAEEQILAGICAARDATEPVAMAVGRGTADIGFNRRQLIDGKVEMVWHQNHDRSHDWGPVDREVAVWRIDRADGGPLALLANYACHPVVMGRDNALLTADFPGATMDRLETAFPDALPFFLQGGCGNIDPYIDVQEDFAAVESQGEELAQSIAGIYRGLKDGVGALEVAPGLSWHEIKQTCARFFDPDQVCELTYGVLRVGRDLAFLALPGEPFVELQLDLNARSPVPHTFLLGYTNGYCGYFPTLQANREGGYGADSGGTMHVEPKVGEEMVEKALEVLQV